MKKASLLLVRLLKCSMYRDLKMKRKILCVIMIFLFSVFIFVLWGNTALEVNYVTVKSSLLPSGFSNFRIAHISDLHNTEFGKDNKDLLKLLENGKPDIIAITGDLIDSKKTNIDIAVAFCEKAVNIAPCYFVTGNHEYNIPDSDYALLKSRLEAVGVTVLENEMTVLSNGSDEMQLIGIHDPAFVDLNDSSEAISKSLESIQYDKNKFSIMLAHRPEVFDAYVENNINLVLSGHAHGGQFRLPFIGGIVAPGQGFFPEYDAGLYTDGNTSMHVSRGLGNSIIPLRFNNRPEVVIIILENSTGSFY